MSHIIEATFLNTETVELSTGTHWRTLDAIMRTGFDLYGAYQASHLYLGTSGTRDFVIVPHSLAYDAFLNSLSWAIAVNAEIVTEISKGIEKLTVGAGVPAWRLLGVTLEDHLAHSELKLPEHLNQDDFSTAMIDADLLGSLIRSSKLSTDIYERALKSANMIIDFTWAVFRGTRSGPASIYFG